MTNIYRFSSLMIIFILAFVWDCLAQEIKGRIKVVVTTQIEGDPVPNETVVLNTYVLGSNELQEIGSGITDKEGSIEFEVTANEDLLLHTLINYSLTTYPNGKKIRLERGGFKEIVIKVPEFKKVCGYVRDSRGNPISGATVVLLADNDPIGSKSDYMFGPVLSSGPPYISHNVSNNPWDVVETRADGSFSSSFRVSLPEYFSKANVLQHVPSILFPVIMFAFTDNSSSLWWAPCGVLKENAVKTDPISLTVFPASELLIEIKDNKGAPVSGCLLKVSENSSSFNQRFQRIDSPRFVPRRIRYEGSTGNNGKAGFLLPFGVNIDFSAGRLSIESKNIRLKRDTDNSYSYRLGKMVNVNGVVVNTKGEPEENVTVIVGDEKVITGKNGDYAFRKEFPEGSLMRAFKEDCIAIEKIIALDENNKFIEPSIILKHLEDLTVVTIQKGLDVFIHADSMLIEPFDQKDNEYYFKKRDPENVDIFAYAPNNGGPKFGFIHLFDTKVIDGAVTIEHLDFDFNASLKVVIESKGRPVAGKLVFACLGVDEFPSIPLFKKCVIDASKELEFKYLQAGDYMVGYEPLNGARQNPYWTYLKVEKGENCIRIDDDVKSGWGGLELSIVDKNGRILQGFAGMMETEKNQIVSGLLENPDKLWANDKGIIRISGYPPGLYWIVITRDYRLSGFVERPVVIPSNGLARRSLKLNMDSAKIEHRSFPEDPTVGLTKAEIAKMALHDNVVQARNLMRKKEFNEAKKRLLALYAENKRDPHLLDALIVCIGGDVKVNRQKDLTDNPEEQLIMKGKADLFQDDLEKLGTSNMLGVLDLLWNSLKSSSRFKDDRDFRNEARFLRLCHLYIHCVENNERFEELKKTAEAVRDSIKDADPMWIKKNEPGLIAIEKEIIKKTGG